MLKTVKETITFCTRLSPKTFITVAALGVAGYYVVTGMFNGLSSHHHHPQQRTRSYKKDTQLGEISEEELKGYDGQDAKKPILIAIKGQIYDVSPGRVFYEPGGPYALFAGKDASRALAKMSFEVEDLNGDLTGLGPYELDALQDWENKFMIKYVKVGSIKKTEPSPESSSAKPTEPTTAEPVDHVSMPTEDSPSEITVGETKEDTTSEANKQE